ncbi:MAG: oligosaccharide flippase family protein [Acidobacteria bacterium]|nr:oligosaccharide flippase family protein [Acidobacteriota bacterium]MCA1639133.1 oligosaccharide flippase family protein [Acidobacteriota bacterium]
MENVKQSETSKSISRNVLYGFSTWVLPFALGFVATPLIVKKLGNKDYGIYALVLSFISYTFILNFSRAVTKYIAEYRSTNEAAKISEIIVATFYINIVLGLFGVSIICLSANQIAETIFHAQGEEQTNIVIALYIAASVLFFFLLGQTFSAILQGIHRFDVYSNIFNFNNVATLLGNIFLVIYGYGLLSLLIWNFVTTFLTFILFAISAKKLLPEFNSNLKPKRDALKLVLKYSSGIVAYQILANLLMLFERSWITEKFGAENFTFYVVTMTLTFNIHTFIASFTQVIFPLVSELKDNNEKLLRLYRRATKTVCFFVFFIASTFIVVSGEFLYLWMGADFSEKSTLLLITHTITFSLLAIQIVSWNMTEGLGYPSYNTFIFVICLIINVFFIIWLTQNYGSLGAAFGRLAGFGTMFFSIFYVEKWIFNQVQTRFWLKLVSVLTIASLVSAAVQKTIISNFTINWAALFISVLCGGICYCSALLALQFVTEEDKLLIKAILSR